MRKNSKDSFVKLVYLLIISIGLTSIISLSGIKTTYAATKLTKIVAGKTYHLKNDSQAVITTKIKRIWSGKIINKYGTTKYYDKLIQFTVRTKWESEFTGNAFEIYTDGDYLYYTTPVKYYIDDANTYEYNGNKQISRTPKIALRKLDFNVLSNSEMISLKGLNPTKTYRFSIDHYCNRYLYIKYWSCENGTPYYDYNFIYNTKDDSYTRHEGSYWFIGNKDNKIYFIDVTTEAGNANIYCASPDFTNKKKICKGQYVNIVDDKLHVIKVNLQKGKERAYEYNLDGSNERAVTPWVDNLDDDFCYTFIGN